MDGGSARLDEAIDFACSAHRGQLYPTPDPQPYVLHLFRVMLAVDGHHARMAAVLHDVLEDTQTTADDLHDAGFPAAVVDAVVVLSHEPQHTYEEYIELVACNELARAIKMADLADNLANNRDLPHTADVVARIDRYELALQRLTELDRERSHAPEKKRVAPSAGQLRPPLAIRRLSYPSSVSSCSGVLGTAR